MKGFKFLIIFFLLTRVAFGQGPQQMFYALNKNNFLLDQIPNISPSVAYSVRKLKRNYNGPLMRVRLARPGSDPEGDVAFDGDGFLSANSQITITKSGGGYSIGDVVDFGSFYSGRNVFVKIWYDQSGFGNDATQTSNSAQPQIVNSGTIITENGRATIQFSGAHNSVYLGLASSISLSNGSLFGVSKVVTAGNTCGIAENGTYSYNLNTWSNTGKIGVTYYGVVDVPSSSLNHSGNLDAISWSKSSSSSFIEVNSRTASSTSSVNIPIAVSQVYGNAQSGNVVDISEFVVTTYAPLITRALIFSNQKENFLTP
jgi:hypothetical protein